MSSDSERISDREQAKRSHHSHFKTL